MDKFFFNPNNSIRRFSRNGIKLAENSANLLIIVKKTHMYRKIRQALKEQEHHPPQRLQGEPTCNPGDEVLLFSKKGTYLVTEVTDSTFSVTCQRWLNSKNQKDRKEEHLWSDLKEVIA
jgi:hypothetical protein